MPPPQPSTARSRAIRRRVQCVPSVPREAVGALVSRVRKTHHYSYPFPYPFPFSTGPPKSERNRLERKTILGSDLGHGNGYGNGNDLSREL